MTTALKLRKGTTAEHASFIGALAEVTVDTDKKTLVVNDGVTPGGTPLAREDSLTKFVRHDTAEQRLTGTQQTNVRTNIGLGSVNNTADLDKPVSTATEEALSNKLGLTGGTLTGPLVLSGNASTPLQAVPKQQVDSLISEALTDFIPTVSRGYKLLTSSTVFEVPADVTSMKVTVVGGGGGGAKGTTALGGGGGGGGVAIQEVTGLTPGSSIQVTVGGAGLGTTIAGTSGKSGGTSSFGSYVSATGGAGGAFYLGGVGGTGSGAGLNFSGSSGATSAEGSGGGTCGGSTGMFGGSPGYGSGNPSQNATGYGHGGGGTVSSQTSGNGSPGLVILEW